MCTCNGTCNCNKPVVKYLDVFQPLFLKHQSAIAEVFVRHGFVDYPVNPLAAGVAFKKKPAIASDIADIIFNDYTGVDGDDKARRQQLTASVLGFFGNVVKAIGDGFGARAASNAVRSAGAGAPDTVVNSQNPPAPPPPAEQDARTIFGLTITQAAIAGGIVLLILSLVLYSIFYKKKS